ncbi:anti-repressor SinI family protein [Bacillus sp. FSL K6-3431]
MTKLDPEWVALITLAKEQGLTIEEIKNLLKRGPGVKTRKNIH